MSALSIERWESLFDLFDGAMCPHTLIALQREVAEEVIALEKIYRTDKKNNRDIRHDIRDLRYLIDAALWEIIHPHAIRQIAIGSGKTPYMMDEEHNLSKIFQILERLADESELPAIIADLTNIIRTGDIVLPAENDGVNFIELKLNAKSKKCLKSPRVQRQVKRMDSIWKYLKDGSGAIGESNTIKNCIELPTYGRETHAKELSRCGLEALENGYSVISLSDHQILIGCSGVENNFPVCLDIAGDMSNDWSSRHACSLSIPQFQSWTHVCPWICKSGDRSVRFEHFRGSLQFVHCYDFDTLLRHIDLDNATFDYVDKLPHESAPGYVVKSGSDTFYQSDRILYDFTHELATYTSFLKKLELSVDSFLEDKPTGLPHQID